MATSLEKKIFELNNQFKYTESEKILLNIIESEHSNAEKYEACILLSNTFKRVFDYNSTEKYLILAKDYATNPGETNNLETLLAMTYFDIQEYSKAEKLMNQLQEKNFFGINNDNKSIILMQQGYVNYLEKDYINAEKKYKESLEIMNSVESCNQPIVYGKMLALYNKNGKENSIDSLYAVGIEAANQCKILKYNIYLTDELIKTIDQSDYKKLAIYRQKLDSMNGIYNTNKNLAELHNTKDNITTNELKKEEKNNTIFSGFIVILVLLLAMVIFFLIRMYKKRRQIEKEYNEIKNSMDYYTSHITQEEKNELDVLFSKKVLSNRQEEILNLLLEGKNNSEIANQLYISENTVKFHVKNIYKILSENNIQFERYNSKKSTKTNKEIIQN